MSVKKLFISILKVFGVFTIYDAITFVPLFMLQELMISDLITTIMPFVSAICLFVISYFLKIGVSREALIAYALLVATEITVTIINLSYEPFLLVLFFNSQIVTNNIHLYLDMSREHLYYIIAGIVPIVQAAISLSAVLLREKRHANI